MYLKVDVGISVVRLRNWYCVCACVYAICHLNYIRYKYGSWKGIRWRSYIDINRKPIVAYKHILNHHYTHIYSLEIIYINLIFKICSVRCLWITTQTCPFSIKSSEILQVAIYPKATFSSPKLNYPQLSPELI